MAIFNVPTPCSWASSWRVSWAAAGIAEMSAMSENACFMIDPLACRWVGSGRATAALTVNFDDVTICPKGVLTGERIQCW